MKVIVINGYPTAGKDTFVYFCQKILGEFRCRNLSTVDCIKKNARYFGYLGEKTPEARRFLAKLKDITSEYNDFSYNYIKKQLNYIQDQESPHYEIVVFIHCREPKEIDRYKTDFNAKTLFIQRDEVNKAQSNQADSDVENYSYDYIIDNNSSLEELKSKAKEFLLKIKADS